MTANRTNEGTAAYTVRGRTPTRSPSAEVTRHVALIRVTLETEARPHDREGDLRVVAERATYGAATAYGYATTRLVDASLLNIEEVEADGDDA